MPPVHPWWCQIQGHMGPHCPVHFRRVGIAYLRGTSLLAAAAMPHASGVLPPPCCLTLPSPASRTLLCFTCNVRALRTLSGSPCLRPFPIHKLFHTHVSSSHSETALQKWLSHCLDQDSVTFPHLCLSGMGSCYWQYTDDTHMHMDGCSKRVIYQNRCHSEIWPKDYSSLHSGLYDTHSWTSDRHFDIKKVKYFSLSWSIFKSRYLDIWSNIVLNVFEEVLFR